MARHKSKEILMAEQIVAGMIRNNNLTPYQVLAKAMDYRNDFKSSVSRQVNDSIWMATLYEFYEDMTKERLKELHDAYLAYFDSYNNGHEKILRLMLEVNELLDGELIDGKIFDVVNREAEAEEEQNEQGV